MKQKWALFSFEGRMRRRDYWLYSLPVIILLLPNIFYLGGNEFLDFLSLIISLCAIYISTALNVKRLKDRNKNPLWIVVTFFPVIGPIFALIELGIFDGTVGPNRYGADPKGRTINGTNERVNKDQCSFNA